MMTSTRSGSTDEHRGKVQAATAALKLVEDGFDAEDELNDSDYDCEY